MKLILTLRGINDKEKVKRLNLYAKEHYHLNGNVRRDEGRFLLETDDEVIELGFRYITAIETLRWLAEQERYKYLVGRTGIS